MSLTRLQADIVLFFVALIWGIAFVAQKSAMEHVGPYTFTALRFLLSAIVVFPFALRERQKAESGNIRLPLGFTMLISVIFTGSLLFQQVGITYTTVANASFLTGLYVICVPVFGWLIYKDRIAGRLYVAALLSIAGLWYLSGSADSGSFTFHKGDLLMLGCAIGFGLHVLLVGKLMQKVKRPLSLCLVQYLVVVVITSCLSLAFETTSIDAIGKAAIPVLYAGIVSGGIAYTLQAVGQQFTPPSDSAIILGSELVFGAIAGVLLLHEAVTPSMLSGGGLIVLSIVIVEVWPLLKKR